MHARVLIKVNKLFNLCYNNTIPKGITTMFKKIILMTFVILSQTIITSENEFKLLSMDDLPWAESTGTSEIDNDSFCIDVISECDISDLETLNEVNMAGNNDRE